MDRKEFLVKMFRMYPLSFNEFNVEDWMEAYKSVLSNPKINYDRLFELMIRKWTSTTNAPHPSWFEENLNVCVEKDDRCAAIVHMEDIKRDAAPMPEDFKIKMAALKEKIGMGQC